MLLSRASSIVDFDNLTIMCIRLTSLCLFWLLLLYNHVFLYLQISIFHQERKVCYFSKTFFYFILSYLPLVSQLHCICNSLVYSTVSAALQHSSLASPLPDPQGVWRSDQPGSENGYTTFKIFGLLANRNWQEVNLQPKPGFLGAFFPEHIVKQQSRKKSYHLVPQQELNSCSFDQLSMTMPAQLGLHPARVFCTVGVTFFLFPHNVIRMVVFLTTASPLAQSS